MGKLLDLLNEFSKDPTKVEVIPELINEATQLEQSEINSQALLEKVQSSNRNLLSQIVAQPEPDEPQEKELSLNDVTDSIISELNGGNE